MSKSKDLFFALLRNALWHTEECLPSDLPEKMAERIFSIAGQQTVLGLVCDALIRNDVKMPQKYVIKAWGLLEQIRRANNLLNNELKVFVQLPIKDYVVVKGQTVAALYPDPNIRMSGDIDFLVHDYGSANVVLKREWNVKLPQRLIDKETAFLHGSVTYEIHTSLMEFGYWRHRQEWQKLMQRKCGFVLVDGVQVQTLEPTVYAVYVFVHLFFHFIREGIGLRQMCDWAVILDRYKDDIDPSQLTTDLDGLGLKRAYRAFGGVLIAHLGLRTFPLPLDEKDKKDSERILKDILRYGNFGKPSRKVQEFGWKFKMETMGRTVRNCWKYFRLAPAEMAMIIPRLAVLNAKLIFSK